MGIVPVQVYAKTVFTETDPSKSDLYTVIFAVIQFCGAMSSALVADKAGRRVRLLLKVCFIINSYYRVVQFNPVSEFKPRQKPTNVYL